MARMVMHRTPVTVRHPVTHQWLGMHRGKELADDDPISTDPDYAWLFEDGPEPGSLTSVRVDGSDVEQATAAPGEKRNARRPAR